MIIYLCFIATYVSFNMYLCITRRNPAFSDSPIHYCNFDEERWCDWTTSYQGMAQEYWYLNRRGTIDYQTGPNNDFTTMTSKGEWQGI